MRPIEDQKITSLPNTATFECEISKENFPVEWQKNGKPIAAMPKKYEIIVDGKIHRLVILNVDEEDDAEYTVVVKKESCKANCYVEGTIANLLSDS